MFNVNYQTDANKNQNKTSFYPQLDWLSSQRHKMTSTGEEVEKEELLLQA